MWSPFFPVFKASTNEVECSYCRISLIFQVLSESPASISSASGADKIRSSKTKLTQIRSGAGCLFLYFDVVVFIVFSSLFSREYSNT
jgi:hypothetical protein